MDENNIGTIVEEALECVSQNEPEINDDGGLSTGVKIALGIGAAAVTALGVKVISTIRKKRKKKSKVDESSEDDESRIKTIKKRLKKKLESKEEPEEKSEDEAEED